MTEGVKTYVSDFGKSNGIDDFDEAVASYFKQHETTSLLQRFLEPEEVANVVVFLTSTLASGINGATQLAEGGIIRHT